MALRNSIPASPKQAKLNSFKQSHSKNKKRESGDIPVIKKFKIMPTPKKLPEKELKTSSRLKNFMSETLSSQQKKSERKGSKSPRNETELQDKSPNNVSQFTIQNLNNSGSKLQIDTSLTSRNINEGDFNYKFNSIKSPIMNRTINLETTVEMPKI